MYAQQAMMEEGWCSAPLMHCDGPKALGKNPSNPSCKTCGKLNPDLSGGESYLLSPGLLSEDRLLLELIAREHLLLHGLATGIVSCQEVPVGCR